VHDLFQLGSLGEAHRVFSSYIEQRMLNRTQCACSNVVFREQLICVKRLMSDVPIFNRNNSDVRFRCLVVY